MRSPETYSGTQLEMNVAQRDVCLKDVMSRSLTSTIQPEPYSTSLAYQDDISRVSRGRYVTNSKLMPRRDGGSISTYASGMAPALASTLNSLRSARAARSLQEAGDVVDHHLDRERVYNSERRRDGVGNTRRERI